MTAGAKGSAAAAVVVDVEEGGRKSGAGARKAGDEGGEQRPAAAGPPGWAPRWALDMHPAGQAAASVGLYFFHMVSKQASTREVDFVILHCCFFAFFAWFID